MWKSKPRWPNCVSTLLVIDAAGQSKNQTNPLSVLFYVYLEQVSVCWTAQSLWEQEWDAENILLIA